VRVAGTDIWLGAEVGYARVLGCRMKEVFLQIPGDGGRIFRMGWKVRQAGHLGEIKDVQKFLEWQIVLRGSMPHLGGELLPRVQSWSSFAGSKREALGDAAQKGPESRAGGMP